MVIFTENIVADRPIILLDEPFASIDHKTSKVIKDYLSQIEDKIIIEITHDLTEENLGRFDELIHMDEGRIKYMGKCKALKVAIKIVAFFVSCETN